MKNNLWTKKVSILGYMVTFSREYLFSGQVFFNEQDLINVYFNAFLMILIRYFRATVLTIT